MNLSAAYVQSKTAYDLENAFYSERGLRLGTFTFWPIPKHRTSASDSGYRRTPSKTTHPYSPAKK